VFVEVVLLERMSRDHFLSSDSRSKGILELIHSNVCGPITIASLNGYLYYVLFIDDHSRKMWIYFLNTKDRFL
jgi:hypothetical protein